MSVLVLVEHDGSNIKDATLATVTAASKLGEVHALVVGNNADGVGQAAAKIAGVAKVHVQCASWYARTITSAATTRVPKGLRSLAVGFTVAIAR